MSDWKCVRPFGVDDGQLDHLERHECFVLGYELAIVDVALKSGSAVDMPIHMDNIDRVKMVLTERKWSISFHPAYVDESGVAHETWARLIVDAKGTRP